MGIQAELEALYRLQEIDNAIADLRREYARLDRGEAERKAYEEAKAAFSTLQETVKKLEAELRDAELELKGVESKRAREEARLKSGAVRSPRELQALEAEVEALGRQRARLDEKVLMLMEALEQRRTEEKEARQALSVAAKQLQAKIDAFNTAATQMKAESQELTEARKEALAKVPSSLLRTYERLRETKEGVAVAAVINGTCTACHLTLPTNTVDRARRYETFVHCDSCGRILYVPED
ncbi:Zn-ribbon protein, possibly nucleic acid-binding [Chthonomonas calidirosea]|uniref:zinc ribbon domain-containing protein n=1 Tax=Chthonomonas calidirosea TaxID=454171 RepID=UPI0006DD3BC7|nr:C4-type zinc ribbon domain-containing protein [Chthonomonas calidirosea]CEK16249.1 Zn-ribbon protein, possibly nucleic acid-binding [Chthonomonas calidirosea]CEK16250.1 Zn-ribbon protein, possibly nucleic acid-binding [Chthonomonas calidirosea]